MGCHHFHFVPCACARCNHDTYIANHVHPKTGPCSFFCLLLIKMLMLLALIPILLGLVYWSSSRGAKIRPPEHMLNATLHAVDTLSKEHVLDNATMHEIVFGLDQGTVLDTHQPSYPGRVAILTIEEGMPYGPISFTKECYASLHGYDMVFDKSPWTAVHGRHPTWNRVPSILHFLQFYAWVLLLDADVAIANYSTRLEEFIHQFRSDSAMVVTDHRRGFNAGAIFFRNTAWTRWALGQWWLRSKRDRSWRWNDQLALWDWVLAYYAERTGRGRHRIKCKCNPLPADQNWNIAHNCFANTLRKLGHPEGNRSAHRIEFWTLDRWPRGFTFYPRVPLLVKYLPNHELYRPGDFTLHTKTVAWIENSTQYPELRANSCTTIE